MELGELRYLYETAADLGDLFWNKLGEVRKSNAKPRKRAEKTRKSGYEPRKKPPKPRKCYIN